MNARRVSLVLAVVALGGATALHAQVSLNAIWGSGPNDLWVAGEAPAALHFDGRTWSEVPFGAARGTEVNALWGSGPQNIFAVGDGGLILRYDGTAWTRMASPTDRELVAVAGRSAGDVYALAQSSSDREAPHLLRFDGSAWTASSLPTPFRANALAVTASEVLVAGFVSNDPGPDERRMVGVLARLSGGRWSLTGWNGQTVTDPVVGGAGWSRLGVAGNTVFLAGERDDGTWAMATSAGGGAWTPLPPAVSAMSQTRVEAAFLAADGVPVVLYDGPGLARLVGGRWTPAMAMGPQQMMMQQMMRQPGAPQQMNPQQLMQMQQMMQNPMMMAVQMAAWDMSEARAAWGPSSDEFYVATGSGRIVRVAGSQAAIVYDARCSDPMAAGMNPICQMLLQQQQIR